MADPPAAARQAAIDEYRGLAILLMVLANYIAGVGWIPAWLKHAPDVGLTVIDSIAPLFIFAIGLTYSLSARRRMERDGWRAAAAHFVRRYLLIAAVGFILSAGEIAFQVDNVSINWGVLQAIGAAGLLAQAVIRLPTGWRLAVGLALLVIYQFLLDRFWLGAVLAAPHGGMQGSLSWGAMLILATVLADLFHRSPAKIGCFLTSSLFTLVAGLALSLLVPISKNRVSASYVLVTLGISALTFAVFALLERWRELPPRLHGLLSLWGRNPLALYVLHLLLLGIVYLPGIPWWYAQAPVWLVLLQLLVILGGLTSAGRFLEKHSLVLKG